MLVVIIILTFFVFFEGFLLYGGCMIVSKQEHDIEILHACLRALKEYIKEETGVDVGSTSNEDIKQALSNLEKSEAEHK